jgi:beta-phosphoglucomutase-like phosphatase (HAD superfamily)
MDGVIADTQKFHSIAESNLLKEYGIIITPEQITKRFSGVNDKDQFETLFLENNLPLPDLGEIVSKKWKIMSQINSSQILPINGVLDMIKDILDEDIKISVASSSPLIFVNHVLDSLEIKHLFQNLTSGEEVQNGKPHPEIFILSANRMGIYDYSKCLVIEDGISGMKGAKKCGMQCLALSTQNIDWVDYCTDDFSKIYIKPILKTQIKYH